MEQISLFLGKYKKPKRAVLHEKAASANEIIAFVGETDRPYGYWLRKIGNLKYGDVLAIVKKAKDLDAFLATKKEKLNRGGYITNQLKAFSTPVDKQVH